MSTKNRFFIYDQAKRQSTNLKSFGSISTGERYLIVDRETNLPVSNADTQYAARQECSMWNSGIYQVESA